MNPNIALYSPIKPAHLFRHPTITKLTKPSHPRNLTLIRNASESNGNLVLDTIVVESLKTLLTQEGGFKDEIGQATGRSVEFTGLLFEPQPWSLQQTKGMPVEYEKYHNDKESYVIVHIPPPIMVKAFAFNPSKLCAIYKFV